MFVTWFSGQFGISLPGFTNKLLHQTRVPHFRFIIYLELLKNVAFLRDFYYLSTETAMSTFSS